MSDNFKAVLKQANNPITGDAIRTGKGGNEKFAAGWDAIFGKKDADLIDTERMVHTLQHEPSEEAMEFYKSLSKSQQDLLDEPAEVKLYGGCLGGGKAWQGSERMSTVFPDNEGAEDKACGCKYTCGATREEWDEDCFGWKECSHCDNGYFPCNQNCIVMS